MSFALVSARDGTERPVLPLCGRELEIEPMLAWAGEIVEELEEHNAWPEGSDALVVEEETGRRWMLTDGWDEITETEENDNG